MDNSSSRQPLLLEKGAGWLFGKCKAYAAPILSVFFFGFLAHMFAFTNKIVNHDDVSALFTKGGSVVMGRWGLEIAEKFLPNYSMPWIYGVLSLALMAAAVCLILDLFQIRNPLLQVLTAGAIIVFPSMTGVFPYMFMSSTYTGCYFFSVLAVWLICRYPKLGLVPAIGCQIFSLSLYQAHISVAAGLLVLVLVQQLLKEDAVLSVIRRGIFFVVFLILSLGSYYLATQLILKWYGIGFNGYTSGSLSFSFANIPQDIVDAYQTFFRYFFQSYLGLIPTAASRLFHGLLLLAIGVLLAVWVLSQKKLHPGRLAMLAAMLLILPLAMNCMHIFATVESIHTLVAFGVSTVYVVAAVVCEAVFPLEDRKRIRQITLNLVTVVLLVVIAVNVFVANQCYLNLHLRYENAYAFYTSLIGQVRSLPEFTEERQLAVVGYYHQSAFYEEKFSVTSNITGTYGFLPDSYSAHEFMEYYIGFPMNFASSEEIAAIQATDAFRQMPCYPYYGSIAVIDDTIIVKLSE